MNLKMKKGKGAFISLILLFSMIVFFDFQATTVKSETFDPFMETFTTTDYMDVANTNVSGWGEGSIYNTNKNPELVGSIKSPFIGPPTEVYVHGDHAILGISGSTNTLETIDISDITNPLENDSITLPSTITSIHIENNYAYLALYEYGLRIVDITDPSNLDLLLGYYDAPDNVFIHDVEVLGDNAFLVLEYSPTYYGIRVFEVSDPNTIIGSSAWTYETNGTVNDIEIKNSFAYVGNSSSMLVLNITDPYYPSLYSEFTDLNNVNDIFIYGNYAFIADESGLVVLDIANPLLPTQAGDYDFMDLRQVIVDGTFAYVVDEFGDVFVLDIADLDNIEQVSMYDYLGVTEAASSIFLHGSHLYVAALTLGMEILEVSNNIQPTRVKRFPLNPGVDRAITIVGDLAYVVGNKFDGLKFHGTLRIYDISDPTDAEPLGDFDLAPGSLNFGHIFYDIEIYGNIAYVMSSFMGIFGTGLCRFRLYAFNIADPTNPSVIGWQPIPLPQEWYGWTEIYTFDISIDEETMYITCGAVGFVMYDFSNPLVPVYEGLFNDSESIIFARDVHIVDDVAFLADGTNGLKILDISNPMDPVRIGLCNTPSAAYKVWIEGDLAYVAAWDSGLQIINIEDLANPTILGSCTTGNWSNNVFVSGDTAFVSDAYGGLVVVDVADSTNPQLLYTYDTDPRCSLDIIVKGDYAFMAEYKGDFEILEVRKNKARQYIDHCQAQSTTIFSGVTTSSLSHATLTNDSNMPAGTAITYFLSADNGVNWEQVTPSIQHDFIKEGRNLKWKAILTTNDFKITPTISSITIDYTTALASPEVVSPTEGFITDDKTPTFTWLEVASAHEYKFQLDNNPDFTSPVIDNINHSSYLFHEVVSPLDEGTYYWRVAAVDDGSEVGYFSQPRSIVIELDISPPDIDHPNDFSYLQGTTGHNITWHASDNFKSTYNITEDGALVAEDTWTEEEIVISVDGLSAGTHIYVCNVYDLFDLFSSDTVLVTVSITQPPIIDDFEDFSYEEGTTGHSITWNPSDNNPDWYNVTRNGVLVVGEDDVWDGSSITISVDGLAIGSYTFICSVYDLDGNSVADSVIVDVIAQIVPTINHPLDFEYESGDMGNTITWYPYDNNLYRYEVELDGEALEAGFWTGDEITVNVDNMNVGVHTIVCTIFDIHDNTAEDTVIVTVVDTTNPTIDHPTDISYTFEDTGNSFTWQPRDNNPQTYVLTLDGEVIESDSWDGGDITVDVDGLDVGSHIYLILITDASGNSVSDSVAVTVLEPVTTPTPTDEEPWSLLLVILSFIGISSLFHYRKKK